MYRALTEEGPKNKEKEKAASVSYFWGLQDFQRLLLRRRLTLRTHILQFSRDMPPGPHAPRSLRSAWMALQWAHAGGRRYAREMTGIYLQAIRLTEGGGGSLNEERER